MSGAGVDEECSSGHLAAVVDDVSAGAVGGGATHGGLLFGWRGVEDGDERACRRTDPVGNGGVEPIGLFMLPGR